MIFFVSLGLDEDKYYIHYMTVRAEFVYWAINFYLVLAPKHSH